jgi:DNA-binding CsgD family transcriptional regulator
MPVPAKPFDPSAFRVVEDADDAALRAVAERLARAVLDGRVASRASTIGNGACALQTRYARFRADDGSELALVVVVGGSAGGRPNRDELRRRFRLTEREAQVAALLADRHSNAEVARQLGVSPHTAARHTERVLRKLSLRSRRDVAAALLEPRRPLRERSDSGR